MNTAQTTGRARRRASSTIRQGASNTPLPMENAATIAAIPAAPASQPARPPCAIVARASSRVARPAEKQAIGNCTWNGRSMFSYWQTAPSSAIQNSGGVWARACAGSSSRTRRQTSRPNPASNATATISGMRPAMRSSAASSSSSALVRTMRCS